MSWNEVKVALAPSGSTVRVRSDPRGITFNGDPVQIIGTRPPGESRDLLPEHGELRAWIESIGFTPGNSNPPYFTYSSTDADIVVEAKHDSVLSMVINLHLELDVRRKVTEWQELVEALCDRFGLKLVDAEAGLVDAGHFRRLVEDSYAWECFLQREKGQEDG